MVDDDELPQEDEGGEPRDLISAQGARILVVDDSPAVRAAVEEILSGPPLNAEIVTAPDGASALKRVIAEPFDCVLCDIAMPVMDGVTFLRTVRRQRSRLELPVIFLTVLEGLSEKVTGFRAGASDFVVKPFEPAELIARVETHVHLQRAYARTHALTRRLRLLVDTDALTALSNRRAFMRALKGELARQKRTERPFCLVLMDVDHFKAVNDEHGHQVGDQVLVHVAAHLKASARPYDTVARVGGEEFALLLPDADIEVGSLVADRMRDSLAHAGRRGDISPAVTVSAGVAEGPVAEGGPDALFKLADQRLYAAKDAGRDRVVGAED
jgi:diguanylate cyclase (GGDEF)-like protein